MYTSMTTSLPATKEISQFLRRDNVFVTDPQPHGRDLNALAYNRNTAPAPGIGNALQNVVPYPVSDEAFRQHEVSVPGSVPTESVRGSIPVDQTTGRLNFPSLERTSTTSLQKTIGMNPMMLTSRHCRILVSQIL